jgi:hypothetical protein
MDKPYHDTKIDIAENSPMLNLGIMIIHMNRRVTEIVRSSARQGF